MMLRTKESEDFVMILEILKLVLALVGCVIIFIAALFALKFCVIGMLQGIISLVKIFEIIFVSIVIGLGSAGMLKYLFYSDGFRYYIPVGIGLFLASLLGIFHLSMRTYIPYVTTIVNALLGGGMGVFIGSCVSQGVLEKKYDPVPIWMYVLVYGGCIAVTVALYIYNYLKGWETDLPDI